MSIHNVPKSIPLVNVATTTNIGETKDSIDDEMLPRQMDDDEIELDPIEESEF